jgi:aspartate/methionine/tyrosine aminotransferase
MTSAASPNRPPRAPGASDEDARFADLLNAPAQHLLGSDDVEPLPLRDLLAWADVDLREEWEALALARTERRGLGLLRREIKKLHARIAEDDVVIGHTADALCHNALAALLRPGDHVIAIWPSARPYAEIARALGAEVSPLPVRPMGHRWAGSKHWMIDISELRAAFRHNTRLLITNFPHNPTGAHPAADEFADIVAITAQNGVFWLSDETQRLLEHAPGDRLPSAVDVYPHALSIAGMDAAFALPGVNVAWAASQSRALIDAIVALREFTTGRGGASDETLATMALRAKERVLTRNIALVKRNLDLLNLFFRQHEAHIDWTPPSAGCVGFPRFKRLDAEQFSRALLREHRALLIPAGAFNYPYNHARIGLGRKRFPEALGQVAKVLGGDGGRQTADGR